MHTAGYELSENRFDHALFQHNQHAAIAVNKVRYVLSEARQAHDGNELSAVKYNATAVTTHLRNLCISDMCHIYYP
jgi:hypothetical protein